MLHRAHAGDEVAVLIPAAGEGKRLGGPRKQFRRIGDHPLLIQTVLAFDRHSSVDCIVAAVPSDHVERQKNEFRGAGLSKDITVIAGGLSRQESVKRALSVVPDSIEIVLVHDAVRPFIHFSSISDVIESVRMNGAAALAIPVGDTLRIGEKGWFGRTIPRTKHYRMQTPQGFRKDWFVEAHRRALEQHLYATDDVDLVQQLGYEVAVVAGSPWNMKVTSADDWEKAISLWPAWIQQHLEEKS